MSGLRGNSHREANVACGNSGYDWANAICEELDGSPLHVLLPGYCANNIAHFCARLMADEQPTYSLSATSCIRIVSVRTCLVGYSSTPWRIREPEQLKVRMKTLPKPVISKGIICKGTCIRYTTKPIGTHAPLRMRVGINTSSEERRSRPELLSGHCDVGSVGQAPTSRQGLHLPT